MPNIFITTDCTAFRMHHDALWIVQTKDCSPSTAKFYLWLVSRAIKNECSATLEEIKAATGLNHTAVTEARRTLVELKLISAERQSDQGGSYTFKLLDGEPSYFYVPRSLMLTDIYKNMKPSTVLFYLTALAFANRNRPTDGSSSSVLNVSADQLRKRAGISRSSGRRALIELSKGSTPFLKSIDGRLQIMHPTEGTPIDAPREGEDATHTRKIYPSAKKAIGGTELFTPENYAKYYGAELELDPRIEQQNVRCPFHVDTRPSMSVNAKKGVWKCHACNIGGGMVAFEMRLSKLNRSRALQTLRAKLGVSGRPKGHGPLTNIHIYRNADGTPLYQFRRYEDGTGLFWRYEGRGIKRSLNNSVRRTLYNLPEVIAASVVLITEGEKKADELSKFCANRVFDQDGKPIAITASGGDDSWKTEYVEFLRGKKVIVLNDSDVDGLMYRDIVSAALNKIAIPTFERDFSALGYNDVREYINQEPKPTPEEFVKYIGSPWLTVAPGPAA